MSRLSTELGVQSVVSAVHQWTLDIIRNIENIYLRFRSYITYLLIYYCYKIKLYF